MLILYLHLSSAHGHCCTLLLEMSHWSQLLLRGENYPLQGRVTECVVIYEAAKALKCSAVTSVILQTLKINNNICFFLTMELKVVGLGT